MNQFDSNAPMMSSSSGATGPAGWLSVWIKAVSQPNEQTFIEITDSPDATMKTAFLWVFLAGTVNGLVSGILQAILAVVGFNQAESLYGFGGSQAASGVGAMLISAICGAPVAGIFSVIGLAIGAGIVQWIAKLFGGTGNFEKLAYAYAAITVPVTLVTMLLTPFSAVPYINICTGLLTLGIGLYVIFLNVTAVKAVNRFDWGKAAASVFLPAVVIVVLCGCIVGASLAILGPAIEEVFRNINQGLTP